MKFKYFNQGLTKKILAGTIAGIISLSGVPKVVYGSTNKANNNASTSISSNACYDELLGTMNTLGGQFKIYKLHDGSINAKHVGDKFTDDIIMKKDGTVKITILKKEKNGNVSSTTETFKINNFFGDSIDINYNSIKDPQIRQTAMMLQKYINSLEFKNENYIKKYCTNPTEENKKKAEQQKNAVYKSLESAMKNNNMKYSMSFASAAAPYYNNVPWDDILLKEGVAKSKEVIGELAETYGAKLLGGTEYAVVLLPIMILSAGFMQLSSTDVELKKPNIQEIVDKLKKINDKALESEVLNDVAVAIPDALGGDQVGVVSIGDVATQAGWLSLAEAMELVIENSKDDDKTNDYFRAVVDKNSNVLFISIFPMDINDAANVLKVASTPAGIPDPNNIYTYKPEDAKAVIRKAGGIPGLSKEGTQDLAENHALSQTYNNFNPKTCEISQTGYHFKTTNQKPGIYFWHYHFYKKDLNGAKNPKHIFFGTPIIITNDDINKLSNKNSFNLYDLESYKTMQVPKNYDTLLTSVSKKLGAPYNTVLTYEDREKNQKVKVKK